MLIKRQGLSIILFLGLILILASCGGDGGSDGESTVETSEPHITYFTLYKIEDSISGGYYWDPKTEFKVGDLVNARMYISDADYDIEEVLVDYYFPYDATKPFYDQPSIYSVPYQTEYGIEIQLSDHITVPGPVGEWRIEAIVVDEQGNQSNVAVEYFSVSIATTLKVRLKDVPDGTMIHDFDITIDYDESSVVYEDVEVGTLTLGMPLADTDNDDAVRIKTGTTWMDEFDGGDNGTILELTFRSVIPNVPVVEDFEVISFSATAFGEDPDINEADIELEVINIDSM